MSLTSDCAKERAAALGQRKAELEAARDHEVRELEAAIARVHEEYRTRIAGAEQRVKEHARACDAAIAEELRTQLPPLVQRYVAEPTRSNAFAIATLWRALNARCLEAVERPIDGGHLTRAFVAAKANGAPMYLGRPPLSNFYGELTVETMKTLGHGQPIDVENALRAFEADIDRRLRPSTDPVKFAWAEKRRAVAQAHASFVFMRVELDELTRARQDEKQANAQASFERERERMEQERRTQGHGHRRVFQQ